MLQPGQTDQAGVLERIWRHLTPLRHLSVRWPAARHRDWSFGLVASRARPDAGSAAGCSWPLALSAVAAAISRNLELDPKQAASVDFNVCCPRHHRHLATQCCRECPACRPRPNSVRSPLCAADGAPSLPSPHRPAAAFNRLEFGRRLNGAQRSRRHIRLNAAEGADTPWLPEWLALPPLIRPRSRRLNEEIGDNDPDWASDLASLASLPLSFFSKTFSFSRATRCSQLWAPKMRTALHLCAICIYSCIYTHTQIERERERERGREREREREREIVILGPGSAAWGPNPPVVPSA